VTEAESQELLQDYRRGDAAAAAAIFDRYVARLETLARSRLGGMLRRRVDPEDVVQSAFRSFFLHARDDAFTLNATGDLWRLLAAITLNKLHGQCEKHAAQKRNAHREVALASSDLAQATAPTTADLAAVIEEFHLALKSLSPIEQRALTLELEGHTLSDIGRVLGKSERSTRRYLAEARTKIERRLVCAHNRRRPFNAVPQATLQYADYRLEKMLAAGGMGKVYRATEKVSGRVVALKSLHKAHLADARAVQKFVQEAQILARLEHPNIVRKRGLGRYPGGGYFIVMDLIEGIDLEAERCRRTFASTEIARILRQVAAALHHAHGQGIVHCDVKPANILLASDGHALVTDFGFAHLTTPTRTENAVGGTRGYVAPEVLHGDVPTPAADIYAIGMLLRVLATGSFAGELSADADEDSRQLERIWRRCLQTDSEMRYATSHELVAEFNRISGERTLA
jgi:RNA polymerase sigma factor (sigma-70 family)